MKKIIYLTSLLIGTLAINTSCGNLDGIYQEEYHKTVLFKTSGVIDQTIYNTGRDTDYKISVLKTGSSPELPADATVSIMSPEEFQAYCADRGLNLTPLSADCYQLQGGLNFEADERYEFSTLTFHTSVINELPATEAEYVVPLILTSQNATVNSEQNVLFVKPHVAPPVVYMGLTGLQAYTYTSDDKTLQSIAVEFPINVDFDNYWDITCNIASTQEALDEYNAAEGTAYSLLPEGSYTMDNQVVIKNRDNQATAYLKVDGTKLSPGYLYALPVIMESVSEFEIDATRSSCFISIYIQDPILEKTDWTVTANSVALNESIKSADALIDGDPNTYWHSRYNSNGEGATNLLPYELIIDMQAEKTVTQIDLQQRVVSSYKDTRGFEVFISSDKNTWTSIGSYEAKQVEGMQSFGLLKSKGRYVKIVIETSYRAANASIAEVDLHGY